VSKRRTSHWLNITARRGAHASRAHRRIDIGDKALYRPDTKTITHAYCGGTR
jgi:hypothetical protein